MLEAGAKLDVLNNVDKKPMEWTKLVKKEKDIRNFIEYINKYL